MSAHAFDFDLPEKESNWFKYEEGEQKIRFLSEPIRGWEEWNEAGGKRSPVRYHYADKPDSPINPEKPAKLFISTIVWNYTKKKIEIFHCDKMSIIKELKKLAEDADWGSLYEYDIRVKREGKEQQTRYTITPLPQKPLDLTIKVAFKAKPIDLQEIFNNGDPFKPVSQPTPMALEGSTIVQKPKDRSVELRAKLDELGCASERLDDCIAYYVNAKKVSANQVIESWLTLKDDTLATNFNNWVAKNPVEENSIEEIPF